MFKCVSSCVRFARAPHSLYRSYASQTTVRSRPHPCTPLHSKPSRPLLDIENASVQNRKNAFVTKWALSSLGKEQEVLVSALTYIGAPTRQRNGLMNKVTRDKRRRMDDVMTNMIDLKTERAINGHWRGSRSGGV